MFTVPTAFGYDLIRSLFECDEVDEVYVQTSPRSYRWRRYVRDLLNLSGIRYRVATFVDRINRPARRMSLEVDASISDMKLVKFSTFDEIKSQILAEDSVTIVYGTRIVPSWVYRGASQAINLHWGLSPYYRGVSCTDWAILNGDLNNIGFTLHELSDSVDGGSIITQGRVKVREGDTVGSITTRLHSKATEKLVRAVAVAKNQKLVGVPQDLTVGRNYRSRDWSVRSALRLKRVLPISNNLLRQSQPELPIHENPSL